MTTAATAPVVPDVGVTIVSPFKALINAVAAAFSAFNVAFSASVAPDASFASETTFSAASINSAPVFDEPDVACHA